MECGEIGARPVGDDHPSLLGLADVASPLLIEAGLDLVERAIFEPQLKYVAGLHITKTRTDRHFLCKTKSD